MNFNSIEYIVFLLIVLVAYYAVSVNCRHYVLIASSIIFYGWWKKEYLLLIFTVIGISYGAALLIDKANCQWKKNLVLIVSVISIIALLGYYKYANFLIQTINVVLEKMKMGNQLNLLDVILPVGISFFSFQAISYIVDVWKETRKIEKSFLHYMLYIMFFPQLVAGPIESSKEFLPQSYAKHEIDWNKIESGLILILIGLFKKVVIADNVAVVVNQVYGETEIFDPGTIFVATVFFSIQIYCDFAGYSDIARGSARLFGYELTINFKAPYRAKSIKDFWSRWHISLTRWLTTYVYIPLGGESQQA